MIGRGITQYLPLNVVSFVGLASLALVHCGGAPDEAPGEAIRSYGEAILGGAVADAAGSPVVYVRSPQGACSGVLVAPNLVATARHCAALGAEGSFSCTPSGDLMSNGSGAGQLGSDDAPGSLSFYLATTVVAGGSNGPPDAFGAQIVSTQSPTDCRDDLSFVVLDRSITGVAPAPIRVNGGTTAGECVSVWGFGLTSQLQDPIALRVHDNAQIVGVGPAMPVSVTQAAPLRAVRIGPGAITCNGDSGGPIISTATGAVIGLVSLGLNASTTSGPTCSDGTVSDTTGPQLADYAALVASAFAAAGATPIPETPAPDAGSSDAAAVDSGVDSGVDSAAPDSATLAADSGTPIVADTAGPVSVPTYSAAGGSCSLGAPGGGRASAAPVLGIALALAAVLRARSRRS